MKKIQTFSQISFHLTNIILIIFYFYPGSLMGYFLYGNIRHQPQITSDFLVSSNHLYAFGFLSMLGFFAYYNSNKINFIFKYLFFISTIFEFAHYFIPMRDFQLKDLFGNILGVYKLWKKL